MKIRNEEIVFLPLGGVGEIGMNLALYGIGSEKNRSWLMVDCGLTFAGHEFPGIDLIYPDIRYIEEEKSRLAGIIITHAHEDHFGALSELWPRLGVPLYLSPFANGLLRAKFAFDEGLPDLPCQIVKPGDRLSIGEFDVEFVAMSHSIPEPMSVVIRNSNETIVHTGDWKIDSSPGIGLANDLDRLTEIGKEGVRALVCDSTNSTREGFSPSEMDVAANLIEIFSQAKNRVAVTLFASNVARIRSVANAARKTNRDVVIVGRAMRRTIDVAADLGYLDDMPEFHDAETFGYFPRENIVALCTGSQGEPRAALAQIAHNNHRHVSLDKGDLVVFSSRTIPGNEKEVGALINGLVDQGVEVLTDKEALVHVSGHPRIDELKELYNLLKPDLLVPVHGESLHLETQADLAEECGINEVVTMRNGDIIRLWPGPAEVIDNAPSGILVKDGNLLIEPEVSGLKERRKLSYTGVATGYISMDQRGEIRGDMQVSLFGLPEEDNSGESFEDLAITGLESAVSGIPKRKRKDTALVEEAARRGMRSAIYERWGKKPLCRVLVNVV